MGIFIGATKLKEIFHGARRVTTAYLGNVLLWQYDNTPPSLSVSTPSSTSSGSPTYTTGGSTYRVSGTVSDTDSGVAAVYVNNSMATLNSDGSWYKDITLGNDTTVTVPVYAIDNAKNQTSTITRHVRFDTSAPSLSVANPSSTSSGVPTYTTSSSYTVSGTVSDKSGIKSLKVNNVAVSVASNGTWSKAISLSANTTTTITVVAIDNAGRNTTVTRYVRYDNAAPSLTVSTPSGTSSSAPTYTAGAAYTVSGTTSDASGIKSLTVNGSGVSVASNGAWSKAISLGANTSTKVSVVSTDRAGRSTAVNRYVYYDSLVPSLVVKTPASGSSSSPTTTYNSSYSVSGTVTDSGSGVNSVTVNNSAASRSGHNWNKAISLSTNVTSTVTVKATDKVGRVSTITRYVRRIIALSQLNKFSTSGLGYTPNFCCFLVQGTGTGGASGVGASACLISNGTSTSLLGFAGMDTEYPHGISGTATYGNGSISVSVSTGISNNTVTGVCGIADAAKLETFSVSANSFTRTISTTFTANFVALIAYTSGTGGNSGYYFSKAGWVSGAGATSLPISGTPGVSIKYNSNSVVLTANYNGSYRWETVRCLVAKI